MIKLTAILNMYLELAIVQDPCICDLHNSCEDARP